MAGPAIESRAGRRVVVRRGDTLYGIAARYLGDPGRWPEILDHNPAIAHPWQIHPGQTLTLPDTTEPADRGGATPRHPGPSSRSRTDHTTDDGDAMGRAAGTPPRRVRRRPPSTTSRTRPPTARDTRTTTPPTPTSTPATRVGWGWRAGCSSVAAWPPR